MAIQVKTPDFPIHHVNVMITADRLNSFWKYCNDDGVEDTAANATVINNTLFLYSFDPVGRETGSDLDKSGSHVLGDSSWSRYCPNSFLHHCLFCYRFGSLNIFMAGSVAASVKDDTAQT
ncbi:hypothetical protein VMCG_05956 [Cytospora schulzeri]|uniref:Uncharacterized protein n=1 Tax=Cytospora schulzeri TaxID=448051 RepID=A0A423WCX5_9PEZI|nr:hypothetical protein VMCG_05956 [Valsa malicola]